MLCQEETEQDHVEGVVKRKIWQQIIAKVVAREEVQDNAVGEELGGAAPERVEWEVAESVPAANIYVRSAKPQHPTYWAPHVLSRFVLNAVPR